MSFPIKEIKEIIKNAQTEDDLTPFIHDERKGVQTLLKSARKKIEKNLLLQEKLATMQQYEKEAFQKGFCRVAGVDEVGRGPLAGPVVAAAVILPEDFNLVGINDSKQLSETKRKFFYDEIKKCAISHHVAIVPHSVIDKVNIYEATKIAMNEALDGLSPSSDFTLIDAMPLKRSIHELSIIKGDSKSVSIAAASILAKVTRDQLMKEYDAKYPGYDFSNNMGYGTKRHLEGLAKLGPCDIHRITFAPVKSYF
ncbi:ribonuclease HII [Listeria fleischmannii subsp. coloradonensis]|uniref:Ribonuclease HII n=1 Tax=Listeria fleischmannii TaxID=1069827 RepID=A0A841YAW1_9LIST|nr:ribonuclease HII [Listeria fleischmannii subsp. coloradonensis]MBC1397422.1 ribonuclease HII [Listeria fleischmannii]MBC1425791.1 ribonuclease HII [Listeria fleischmannii]